MQSGSDRVDKNAGIVINTDCGVIKPQNSLPVKKRIVIVRHASNMPKFGVPLKSIQKKYRSKYDRIAIVKEMLQIINQNKPSATKRLKATTQVNMNKVHLQMNNANEGVLEKLYNFRSQYIVQKNLLFPPIQKIAKTTCVFSTPTIMTPRVQPSTGIVFKQPIVFTTEEIVGDASRVQKELRAQAMNTSGGESSRN